MWNPSVRWSVGSPTQFAFLYITLQSCRASIPSLSYRSPVCPLFSRILLSLPLPFSVPLTLLLILPSVPWPLLSPSESFLPIQSRIVLLVALHVLISSYLLSSSFILLSLLRSFLLSLLPSLSPSLSPPLSPFLFPFLFSSLFPTILGINWLINWLIN